MILFCLRVTDTAKPFHGLLGEALVHELVHILVVFAHH